MYACMHVCINAFVYVRMYADIYGCTRAPMCVHQRAHICISQAFPVLHWHVQDTNATLQRVKNKLLQRAGNGGFRSLVRILKIMDDDGNRKLTKSELVGVCDPSAFVKGIVNGMRRGIFRVIARPSFERDSNVQVPK